VIQLSEVYIEKTKSCQLAIEQMGVETVALVAKYEGMVFPGTQIDKANAFAEVIAGTLTNESFEYMTGACSLTYLRDNRLPHEYAVDLVLGWLMEDAVLERIQIHQPGAVLAGHDRFREFLSPQKISTQPDIRIGGEPGRLLEIFADWKGTWRRRNHADLRDRKYLRMVQEEALLLGLAPLTAEGFLMSFPTESGVFVENYIPGYRKMGYTTRRVREQLRPIGQVMDHLERELQTLRH
jgi:hypothetical protein